MSSSQSQTLAHSVLSLSVGHNKRPKRTKKVNCGAKSKTCLLSWKNFQGNTIVKYKTIIKQINRLKWITKQTK